MSDAELFAVIGHNDAVEYIRDARKHGYTESRAGYVSMHDAQAQTAAGMAYDSAKGGL